MTTEELINYYVDLLIAQYRPLPNARATVAAYVREAVADQIFSQVLDAYAIGTSVGVQLDVLGKYVGVTRYVNGLDLFRDFFALINYGDTPTGYFGFVAYGDSPTAFFAQYDDFANIYSLNDAEMARLISLKILLDKSDHSLKDIDDIMFAFFTTNVEVTDGLNMTMTYAFNPASTDTFIKIVAFLGILPAPAGVTINITGV